MKVKYYSRKLSNRCVPCGKPNSNGFILHKDGSETPCHPLCARKLVPRIKLRQRTISRYPSQENTKQTKIAQNQTGNFEKVAVVGVNQ